jgi:hypothetical protein
MNHITAEKYDFNGTIRMTPYEFVQDRFKFGAEVQVAPIDILSLGLRFDRVMPDADKSELAYSAISPRLILHSKFLSREYLILNYSRFFLGDGVRPSEPYRNPAALEEPHASITSPDENLVSLTALVAF